MVEVFFTSVCLQLRSTQRSDWPGSGSCFRRNWVWTWALPSAWTQRSCSMMRTWTTAVRPVGAMEADPTLAPAPATTRSVSVTLEGSERDLKGKVSGSERLWRTRASDNGGFMSVMSIQLPVPGVGGLCLIGCLSPVLASVRQVGGMDPNPCPRTVRLPLKMAFVYR